MEKTNSKKRMQQVILIIGVVVIPLLYSYFYLGAFWDPYSRLDTLPVAIVNNDRGAVINGENRNLGQELCNELNKENALKFIMTDKTTAQKGTEGTDYYAMIVIPDNFSEDVASSETTDKQIASLTFSSNEKRNYLATQILSKATLEIEKELRSNINKEITAELSDKLQEVPDSLGDLQDGLGQLQDGATDLTDGTTQLQDGTGQLQDGSSQLVSGAAQLASGTTEFSNQFDAYQNGISDAASGVQELTDGTGDLDSGIEQLLNGATQLETSTQDLPKLQEGAAALAENINTFNNSLTAYTSGVSQLVGNVTNTATFLSQYAAANPTLMNDPTFAAFMGSLTSTENQTNIQTLMAATEALNTASNQLSAGAAQLSGGASSLSDLKSAISTIKSGLQNAKAGSTQLASGSSELNAGMTTLQSATQQLGAASKEINSGAKELNQGAVSLNSGIKDVNSGAKGLVNGQLALLNGMKTAKDGVDSSLDDANEQLKSLDGLDEFAENPVTVEQASINPVPNYGTAFSPYFLSLSLWVGALIIFVGIFLDSDEKFKLLSRHSKNKALRTVIYLFIGLTQAIVLAIVLKLILGLEVNHLGLFFLSCCLVSMVFLSIVQFLMIFFKDIGKFLALLLLILQLTSCGGTFPMETVPKFFNLLYPFMPMTYSVNLFKEAISGTGSGAGYNILVLVGILVVFTVLTVVFSGAKKAKAVESNSYKPLVSGQS